MEKNGFTAETKDMDDLSAVKSQYAVPPELQSCHTAIVDGYVVEGHVPVSEVNRLLSERPAVIGIAVPGMPMGSPGMEVSGQAAQPFDVITFAKDGKTEVYASYGK